MARTRKHNDAQIIEALTKSRGFVYIAAKMLQCSTRLIQLRIKESAKVRDALADINGLQLDIGEGKLFKAVDVGEAWAVRYFLSTKGRPRGYGEKLEVEHSGRLTVNLPPGMRKRQL